MKKKIIVILPHYTSNDIFAQGREGDNIKLFDALEKLSGDYDFITIEDHGDLEEKFTAVSKTKNTLVLNFCDTGLFNDPKQEKAIPEMLEKFGISYAGAGADCMIRCYNKFHALEKAAERLVPAPPTLLIDYFDASRMEAEMEEAGIAFPAFVKPNEADGSAGITSKNVAYALDALWDRIICLRNEFEDTNFLIQKYLNGKEISVGIIGDRILPIVEVDFSDFPADEFKINSFETEQVPASPCYNMVKAIPASLNKKTERQIINWSREIFEEMGCRDYSVIDWRFDEEERPYFLEVNPNPSWCLDGQLARMAELDGMPYHEMISNIIRAAEKRLIPASPYMAAAEKKSTKVKTSA